MADTLIEVTPEKLATKSGAGWLNYETASEYSGISVAELRKGRAEGILNPDGKLLTGSRGRPGLLFRKGTIQTFKRTLAQNKAAAAAAAEAALTEADETEVPTEA